MRAAGVMESLLGVVVEFAGAKTVAV